MADALMLLVKHTATHSGTTWLDQLGPFGPPVIAAVVGAAAGLVASVASVGSQERAKDRYQARRTIAEALGLLRAYIEHQRVTGFPDVSVPAGQIGIDRRVEFVVSTYRQTAQLGRRERQRVEADLERLVGVEATYLTKDRAALPVSLVDWKAEYAAKSLAFIPEVKAGTFKRGLLEDLARAGAGVDEQERAAVACLDAIDAALRDLMGGWWRRRWRGWRR